jgi:hypothetical protein
MGFGPLVGQMNGPHMFYCQPEKKAYYAISGAMSLNLNSGALARYSGNSADSAKKQNIITSCRLSCYSALIAHYFFIVYRCNGNLLHEPPIM